MLRRVAGEGGGSEDVVVVVGDSQKVEDTSDVKQRPLELMVCDVLEVPREEERLPAG